MSVLGVPAPDDFPTEPWAEVAFLFGTWPRVDGDAEGAWEQARSSWHGVGYRFLAAARWDEEWRASLAANGTAPRPEVRLFQETALFGFYVAALAVVDSFCYSVFASGALARPTDFPEALKRQEQRKINASATLTRLRDLYPELPLTASLRTALDSADYQQLSEIRNMLVHRLLPSRNYLEPFAPRVLASEWQLKGKHVETVAITRDLTAEPRAWLSRTLASLIPDMAAFVQTFRSETGASVAVTAIVLEDAGALAGHICTQRVTKVDLAHGRIRLPRLAKALLPRARGRARIVLRGVPLEVGYDPRFGPDRERSAVLSIGRNTLSQLVREEEVLEIRLMPDGSVELD